MHLLFKRESNTTPHGLEKQHPLDSGGWDSPSHLVNSTAQYVPSPISRLLLGTDSFFRASKGWGPSVISTTRPTDCRTRQFNSVIAKALPIGFAPVPSSSATPHRSRAKAR